MRQSSSCASVWVFTCGTLSLGSSCKIDGPVFGCLHCGMDLATLKVTSQSASWIQHLDSTLHISRHSELHFLLGLQPALGMICKSSLSISVAFFLSQKYWQPLPFCIILFTMFPLSSDSHGVFCTKLKCASSFSRKQL